MVDFLLALYLGELGILAIINQFRLDAAKNDIMILVIYFYVCRS